MITCNTAVRQSFLPHILCLLTTGMLTNCLSSMGIHPTWKRNDFMQISYGKAHVNLYEKVPQTSGRNSATIASITLNQRSIWVIWVHLGYRNKMCFLESCLIYNPRIASFLTIDVNSKSYVPIINYHENNNIV